MAAASPFLLDYEGRAHPLQVCFADSLHPQQVIDVLVRAPGDDAGGEDRADPFRQLKLFLSGGAGAFISSPLAKRCNSAPWDGQQAESRSRAVPRR